MANSTSIANLVLAIHARNHTHAAFAGVGQGLSRLRADAAYAALAIGAGVSAGVVGAVKSASEFQRTMTQTAALTNRAASEIGASNKQMAQGFVGTSKQVLDAVSQTGRSAQDLGEALYFIASSGFTKAADAEKLMVLSGKDATIGHVQAKVAADALTTSLNAYGQHADQAAKYNDILLQGVNLGKAEFGDFARSLGAVLPLAAQAGVRFQDVTAALSTLTLSGLSPRRAAMDLNRLIQSVLAPTKGQRQIALALGIDFSKADLSTPAGLVHFLDLVKSKVDQFPQGERAQIFKHLFSNQAAILGAQILTNNIGNLKNNVEVMSQTVGNGTVTSRAYGEVSKTLAVQFETLKNRVGAAAIQLGGVLSPVALRLVHIAGALLPGALQTLTALIRGIEHPTAAWRTALAFAAGTARAFVSALGGLFSTLGTIAGALGRLLGPLAGSRAGLRGARQASVGLGTALGLLVPAMLTYIGLARTVSALTLLWASATKAWTVVTKGATGAQALLNLVMAANPIALVIVAIAALTLGLVYAWNHWKGFHNFVVGAWQWLASVLRPGLGALAAFLRGPLSAAWDRVKKAVHDGWYIIRVLWQLIKDNVIPAIKAFAHNLQTELVAAWVETTQKVQVAWDLLKAFWGWLTNVFDLKSAGKNLRDALGGAFDDIKAKITGFLLIWQGALKALAHVPGMGWIKGALHALVQARHEVDAHDAAQRHRHAAAVADAHVAANARLRLAGKFAGQHEGGAASGAGPTHPVQHRHEHKHEHRHSGPTGGPVDRGAVERVLRGGAGGAGGAGSTATDVARDFSTALGYFMASKGLDPTDVTRMQADIAAMRAQDPVRAAKLQQQLDTALAHRREAIRHQGAVEAHHRQVSAQRAAHHAQVVAHHRQQVAHQAALRNANADASTLLKTIHSEIREHRFGHAARDIKSYAKLVEQADRLRGLDPQRARADAAARARTLTDELHRAEQRHPARPTFAAIAPVARYGGLTGETGYGQTTVSFGGAQANPLQQIVAELRAQLTFWKQRAERDERVIALLEGGNTIGSGILRGIQSLDHHAGHPPPPQPAHSVNSHLKATGGFTLVGRP